MGRFGDIRDVLLELPHGDPEGATRYVELDLFPVRHAIIRELEPAPRSVFEFGALYGYFLVTAIDAAPSIRHVGWIDDESHTPWSNAMALANVEAVVADRDDWTTPSGIFYGTHRDVLQRVLATYDLVQVDGAHDRRSVFADLTAAELLRPRWIMLDDWTAHHGVREGFNDWFGYQPDGRWALTEHQTVNGLAMLTRRPS